MSGIRDRATEVVVGLDPRRAAEGTLRLVMPHMRASSAGLFRIEGERLSLFVGCSVAQADLDRALEAWEDGRESILAGHTYTEAGSAVVPIGDGGLVYLGSAGTLQLDLGLIDEAAPFLRAALREPGEERPPAVDLESTPTPEFDRGRLLVLLHRHEWNIARVARILAVERSTVYRRMERWKIPRQRVPKT